MWQGMNSKLLSHFADLALFFLGQAVFLENDRRRSSWLPAVIVPAHYVLEDSEMSPDTICLRSFKDGR